MHGQCTVSLMLLEKNQPGPKEWVGMNGSMTLGNSHSKRFIPA